MPVKVIWNYSCGKHLEVERFFKEDVDSDLFLEGKCADSSMENRGG